VSLGFGGDDDDKDKHIELAELLSFRLGRYIIGYCVTVVVVAVAAVVVTHLAITKTSIHFYLPPRRIRAEMEQLTIVEVAERNHGGSSGSSSSRINRNYKGFPTSDAGCDAGWRGLRGLSCWKICLMSALAGFGGLLFGYDTGNINGIMAMPYFENMYL
jgi:hypothetical protein